MLFVGSHLRQFKMTPTKRRSFCKEFKLKITNPNFEPHFENRKTINQTANNFHIDRKQLRNWLKDEKKIRSLKLLKKTFRYGKAKFPVMEK